MERRTSGRVEFIAPTSIEESSAYRPGGYGKVVNISNSGAFIKTSESYALNDEVVVSIHLITGDATLSVTMPGTVARITEEGIGFHSPHLDVSSLLYFDDLMHSNKADTNQVQNDFFSYAVDALYPTTLTNRRWS
jgi:PilZ domain